MASLFRDVKILLKKANPHNKNFTRKFHNTKIQKFVLTYPHSFLTNKNSNVTKLGTINFKHGLRSLETYVPKNSENVPLKTIKSNIVNDKVGSVAEEMPNAFDEASEVIEPVEAKNDAEAKARQFKKEIRNVFENDREFYIKNYKEKINVELFKGIC